MSPSDFLKLPAYVAAPIAVMFSPAVLAAAQLIVAFAGDIVRQQWEMRPQEIRRLREQTPPENYEVRFLAVGVSQPPGGK